MRTKIKKTRQSETIKQRASLWSTLADMRCHYGILRDVEVVSKKGLEINFSWKSRSAVYTVSELHFMQITMFRKIYTSYVSQWIKSSNQCLFSTRGKQVLNPLWNKSFLVWRTVPSRQRSASGMVGRRRDNFGTKVRRLLIKQFVPCSAAEVPFRTLFIVKFCLQNFAVSGRRSEN